MLLKKLTQTLFLDEQILRLFVIPRGERIVIGIVNFCSFYTLIRWPRTHIAYATHVLNQIDGGNTRKGDRNTYGPLLHMNVLLM